jgi:hypothetical protein
VGLVLGIFVLVIIIVGLYSISWYSNTEELPWGGSISLTYGLYDVEGTMDYTSVELSYEEIQSQSTTTSVVVSVAERTRGIVFLGLFFLGLFIILALLGVLDKGSGFVGRATFVVGYMAGFFLLVAAIYFAIAFPNALEEENGTEPSGSFGGAWLTVLFGSLLVFLSAEVIRRKHSDHEVYNPPYYHPI